MGATKSSNGAVKEKNHENLKYHHGFGNTFRSESIPNSLPKLGHNPRDVPYGLYTEGITGSAFTAPRNKNRRSWFWRIRPSVVHFPYEPYKGNTALVSQFTDDDAVTMTPQQMRWDPFTVKGAANADFVDGIRTICGAGDPNLRNGVSINCYEFGKDMERKAMYTADGDLLFMPKKGELLITTEFGKMHVPPDHIAVVQRSMKFTVQRVGDDAKDGTATGYLVEVYKGHYELPELGPIGGNGLANLEDWETPTASYLDEDVDWTIVAKFGGKLYQFKQDHSPYDVVAWMGNYVPFRYDMKKFSPMGSILYDHPDPSISCLLTVPSDTPGTAIIDIMCFGDRWSAVEDTFRPQWFHRNICSEFMCTIKGAPAPNDGCNLHNPCSAHGPDSKITDLGYSANAPTGPVKQLQGIRFVMVESCYPLATTKWSMEESGKLQPNYWKEMWQNISRHDSLPASSE